MDALPSQCIKKPWKSNRKMKKLMNVKQQSKTTNKIFHKDSIAEIKHGVKTEKNKSNVLNFSKLDGNLEFNNKKNTREYCKRNKIHDLERTKKPSEIITETCTKLYKNYAKSKNETYFSVSTIYSSETKESSVKLFYCNKKKQTNKAFFYKDICITGEKIALWRKLKGKISTSSDNDCKLKNMGNFIKPSQSNKTYQEGETCGTTKPKTKPFFQKYLTFYCKCDEAKKIKCAKLPLIQFPDLPEHRLYENCTCLKRSSDASVFKLCNCEDNKSCEMIRNSKTSLTHRNTIIVKSSKTEIGITCGEKHTVATKGVSCDINNAKFDTYTDMSEIILFQNNSTQYLEQDIENCEYIITEKRCVSTQDDIQVVCGDQNQETHETNQSNINEGLGSSFLPQFTKQNFCDKSRIFIKKFNKKCIESIICKPQKKHYTRKTQTCINNKRSIKYGTDDRKNFFRSLEKSIGTKCPTSNAQCQTFKKNKYQRTKKVYVKTRGSTKSSMFKIPLPELSTKRIQCGRPPPICKIKKNSNLVRLCKRLSCSKINKRTCKYDSLNTPKCCKCNKISVSLKKSCEKCTSCMKARCISVETQCPLVKGKGNKEIRNEKISVKKKFWKQRAAKVSDNTVVSLKKLKNSKANTLCHQKCSRKLTCKQSCNSVGIQFCPQKPPICSCTKDLYFSKSCNTIICRKQPKRPNSTQEFQKHLMKNILKIKHNLSLFNFKKFKPLEPCRCIQSLMLIDEAYRNYQVNPALVSQINRCDRNCLFFNQDCKHLTYSKFRRALIAELTKKYVNRSVQCKLKQCAKCKRKQKDCTIIGDCNNCPVSRYTHSCSAYCNACNKLPCNIPWRSILSENANECKKCGRKCKTKRFTSNSFAHHCKRPTISSIRCHFKKLRLLIFGKETCGCKRQRSRRPKVHDDPNKIFLNTVRKPRYTRIYRLCPWAYPECLKCLGIWKQNIQIILVIIAWILWCPCIILMELFRLCCCYFCYE